MPQYKCRYEYHSVVTIMVEADSKKEAEKLTQDEANDHAHVNLTAYSLDVEEQ
jgi:hypothetical protein